MYNQRWLSERLVLLQRLSQSVTIFSYMYCCTIDNDPSPPSSYRCLIHYMYLRVHCSVSPVLSLSSENSDSTVIQSVVGLFNLYSGIYPRPRHASPCSPTLPSYTATEAELHCVSSSQMGPGEIVRNKTGSNPPTLLPPKFLAQGLRDMRHILSLFSSSLLF